VGGIKEKILAATRSGADTVILPHSNKSDFQDLPKYVIIELNIRSCTLFSLALITNITFELYFYLSNQCTYRYKIALPSTLQQNIRR